MTSRILSVSLLAILLTAPWLVRAQDAQVRNDAQADSRIDRHADIPVGPILLGGGAVTFLAVGGALAIEADSNNDAYNAKPTSDGADDVEAASIASVVCLSAGGAMAVGALLWWLLADDNDTKGKNVSASAVSRPEIAVGSLKSGGVVSLSVEF